MLPALYAQQAVLQAVQPVTLDIIFVPGPHVQARAQLGPTKTMRLGPALHATLIVQPVREQHIHNALLAVRDISSWIHHARRVALWAFGQIQPPTLANHAILHVEHAPVPVSITVLLVTMGSITLEVFCIPVSPFALTGYGGIKPIRHVNLVTLTVSHAPVGKIPNATPAKRA
jgi:hypothetical protein